VSEWTHSQCDDCWDDRHPSPRTPVRTREKEQELCCFCGTPNISGIYVREDPLKTLCKGQHPV
jgi:hypothetical protein